MQRTFTHTIELSREVNQKEVQAKVQRLNARFRDGQPSDNITEVGIIFKQFDGLEAPLRPWEACVGPLCKCWGQQGEMMPGRVSAMIAYRGLRRRADRVAIPLPYPDRTGVVLRNSEVSLECLYGIDGATNRMAKGLTDPSHPGCTTTLCDTRSLCALGNLSDGCGYGRSMCGFVGEPATAWHAADLKLLMTMHRAYGTKYTPPGFHSGYNEVILSSATLNARLPAVVEAFFVVEGAHANHDATGIDVVRAHRDFLERYRLTEAEVPLLKLSPSQWDAPFSPLRRVLVRTATRPASSRWVRRSKPG